MTREALDSPIEWVAEHTRAYVESAGADGYMWRGVPTLILTTTGRISGQLRRNPLIFGREHGDSGGYVIVASRGGHATDPLWYRNLVASPAVQVQVGPDVLDATARVVAGEERARLWEHMAAVWPAYDDYQARTAREIPVVVLDPRPGFWRQ